MTGVQTCALPISFAGEGDYGKLRQRILKVSVFRPYPKSAAVAWGVAGTMMLAGAFFLVIHSSYPRYVEENYIVVQENNKDPIVILDSEEYARALSWDDTCVLIHRVAMDQLLEKYGVEGKKFWLGFGGYSKIPKMSSGGNCVEVDYRGKEEILQIPYSNSENNFWITLVKQIP